MVTGVSSNSIHLNMCRYISLFSHNIFHIDKNIYQETRYFILKKNVLSPVFGFCSVSSRLNKKISDQVVSPFIYFMFISSII